MNVELVRRGAATPYFRGGDEGTYADELLDAAADARDASRGMWGSCRVSGTRTGLSPLSGGRASSDEGRSRGEPRPSARRVWTSKRALQRADDAEL